MPEKIICVLGMHRSGTSVVSRILSLLGAYLGPDGTALEATPDNPKGYFEHRHLVAINDEILSCFGGSWDHPPHFPHGWATSPQLEELRQHAAEMVARDFGQARFWAWKDPRTSLTIPFWQQVLPPLLRYVVVLRNPVDVARSLARRDGFSIEKSGRIWLHYVASAIEQTSGHPRLIVFYENVMEDWERELTRLAEFVGKPALARDARILQQAGEFLEQELYHHRTPVAKCVDETTLAFPPKSLYLALRALHSQSAGQGVREDLDAAIDRFAVQASEHQRAEEQEARRLATLTEQDSAHEKVVVELGERLQEEMENRSRLEKGRDQLAAMVETTTIAMSSAQEGLRALRAEIAHLRRDRLSAPGRFLRGAWMTAKALGVYPVPRTLATYKAIALLLMRPRSLRDAYFIGASGVFDALYYSSRHADVAGSHLRPLMHFILYGAQEGRQAHPVFDPAWYVMLSPDVGRQSNNPLAHYLRHGGREGRDPHPLFSSAFYLGGLEGMPAVSSNPLVDYLRVGFKESRAPHPLFDPGYYLERNPDVRRAGADPLSHFLVSGAVEQRNPNPFFDSGYYARQVPELAERGVNPLVHFIRQGWRKGLNPSPGFDMAFYLEQHPDVRQSGVNPLEHYLLYGRREARAIRSAGASRESGSAASRFRESSASRSVETATSRRTCRRFALYTSSLGNYFFWEIRDLLAAGLRELGLEVETRDEQDGFSEAADWHVVIAPHEFFYLGGGVQLWREDTPPRLIVVNTEQPSTRWFSLAFDCFSRAHAVWDINFESSQRINARGHRCSYLALGYTPGFEGSREVPVLPEHYGTRFLERDIRQWSARPLLADRPIDVLFVGHASPRREQFFAKAAFVLARHRAYLHFSNVAAPVIPGRTTHMDTPTVMGLAQRSRILLNIHHGDDRYFEWHRIVIEGIWQRALVVSEPCGVAPPFKAGLDFVDAPIGDIPSVLEHYLSSQDGRREAQEIVDRGFRTLMSECRLARTLRDLILALHGIPEFPEGFVEISRLPPAEPPPAAHPHDEAQGRLVATGTGAS